MKKTLFNKGYLKAFILLLQIMPFLFLQTAAAHIRPVANQDHFFLNTNKGAVIHHIATNLFSAPNTATFNHIAVSVQSIAAAMAAPPTITCPANIKTDAAPGLCSARVILSPPVLSDPDGDIISLSWSMSGVNNESSPLTGINNLVDFVFNVGVTTVTYTVTDASPNVVTCSFTVTVYDKQPPSIACPSDTIIFIPACFTFPATLALTPPKVSDNCGIPILLNNAPAQFPEGETSVIWNAKDINNLTSFSCNQIVTVRKAPAMSLTLSSTPVSCFGGTNGSATANVVNGTPAYTYAWNTVPVQTTATATNLGPGNYSVVVTDFNGCSTNGSVSITAPLAALSALVTDLVNVACYGNSTGTFTAAGSGGTPPYEYSTDGVTFQSSGIFSGLSAGTYTLTIRDANGCIHTTPVIISQPAATLAASITAPVNVLCFGQATGSATVTATGGITPYAYAWNTVPPQTTATATNIAAGTYSVTVTDAGGCTVTVGITITQPEALSGTITAQVNVACFGNSTGSFTAEGSGGILPYQYSLNAGAYQASGIFSALAAGNYTVTVRDANNCTFDVSTAVTQPLAGLTATTDQVNVACFGQANGSATAIPAGGTSPYIFSWNTIPVQTTATAANLTAGAYTVTVTDAAGCIATAGVIITQPAAVLSGAITDQVNILCFGLSTGSVTIAGSGGSLPYQYSLNGGARQAGGSFLNLAAGTYTVTVSDAGNCSFDVTVTITQPATGLTATIDSQTNLTCFGQTSGNATVTASGGTLPYAYAWNTVPVQNSATANNLAAGTYTVSIADATGCTATATVTITQPEALIATIASQVNILCFGKADGSATVVATGGTQPYTYSWNSIPAQTTVIATNLIPGIYTVSVTDAGGCITTASVTITEPASALTASITSQVDVLCFGNATGSATVAGSGGTPPYQYSLNGGAYQDNGTYTNLAAAIYTVTVKDAVNCTFDIPVTILQPASGLSAAISSKANVACFGQTSGSATVTASGGTLPYAYSWNTVPVQSTATAGNLAPGVYIVTVTDAAGCADTASVTLTQPAELKATITSQLSEDCAGNANGSVTVEASGGTPAYLFSLNGGADQPSGIFGNLSTGNYTITAKDAGNCTFDVAVNIALLGLPQANEDFISTPEDTAVSGNVMVNDRGFCYPPVTVTSNTAPLNGSVVIQPDGTFTYTPLSNYNGADFFTYTITDIKGNFSTTQVSITIVSVNDPPVAVDDRDTTTFNKPVTISILSNDSDVEHGILTISTCGLPTNGSLLVNSDGTATYTPNTDYTGNDEFCYIICDDGIPSRCDTAMVYIYVKPGILVYNGFSPNGDGNNDHLAIRGIEDFPDNEIQIFNRYGDKIRKISRYDNHNVFWDGTNNNGKQVPDGTYFYILKIKDASTLTGWIFIRGKK